jgi:hypothetical protein
MLEQCPLLAQSGHHDGAPECLLSGAKRTLRGHALMAAFDRKRTSGGARLREGQREKGRQQKNCGHRRGLFFAFSKLG